MVNTFHIPQPKSSMGCIPLQFQIILILFSYFSSSYSLLCHPNQSSALLEFKTSFTTIKTDYSSSDACHKSYANTPTWKNGTDCCSWLGVTCDPLSGHVTGMDLTCNGLQGKIHPNSSIFGLSHLKTLNLSGSNIQGEVPSQISLLSKLESLDLSWNYQLKWNQCTWMRFLKNVTMLKKLVLDYTDMSSIMSLNLSSSSLVTLSFSSTGLRGNLTNDILCLPNLQNLILSNNYLNGQIPNVFPQSSKFQVLDLSNNSFVGELPSTISNLQSLIHLDLSSNRFIGEIPDVFGELNNLKTLDLSSNSLRGLIPSSLFDSSQLYFLNCSNNKLEGSLPNNITGFSSLTSLRLSNNLLNGTIPSWCFSLPSLIGLDLSNNQFTGNITAISSHSLKILLLCSNMLQGNIPHSIFNLVNLTALCLSSNRLNGTIQFPLFSKLSNLEVLSISQNSQLILNFESNVNYSFSSLKILELSSMSLTEFPELLGKFPRLSVLDMSNNKLSKVPNWLHEMDSLSILNLSQNLLTSSLDQFSGNYRLIDLDLSFNLLSGEISSSICNLSSLQIINLSNNKLTGTIPQCLVNLQSLQVLDLHVNELHGSLPVFSENNNLTDLDLNGNQLQGPLPESLSKCTQLQILNLGNNIIEDTFPNWLHTLPNLRVLVLRDNKFKGHIPSLKTKHLFPSLTILDISSNNFSGSLPTAYIKNLESMRISAELKSSLQYMEFEYIMYGNKYEYHSQSFDSLIVTMKGNNVILTRIPTIFVTIDFSSNNFEGEIPNVIGELHALKGLNLSHNRLIGAIPESIGNLANLESLDLSSNMLNGGIPTELTNLNYLAVLNLSYNHLVGGISQGKQFNTFSNDSYEGNLELCGLPMTVKCNMSSEKYSPALSIFWSEEKFGFGWKPVAIGYGCGMVFGVGLGCCLLLIRKPQWLVRMVE